jgi:hypothetical protein
MEAALPTSMPLPDSGAALSAADGGGAPEMDFIQVLTEAAAGEIVLPCRPTITGVTDAGSPALSERLPPELSRLLAALFQKIVVNEEKVFVVVGGQHDGEEPADAGDGSEPNDAPTSDGLPLIESLIQAMAAALQGTGQLDGQSLAPDRVDPGRTLANAGTQKAAWQPRLEQLKALLSEAMHGASEEAAVPTLDAELPAPLQVDPSQPPMSHAPAQSDAAPAPRAVEEAGFAAVKPAPAVSEKAFAGEGLVAEEPSDALPPAHGGSPAQEQRHENGESARERLAGASTGRPEASPHQPSASHFAIQPVEGTAEHAPDVPNRTVQPSHLLEEWDVQGRPAQPSVSLEVYPPDVGRVRLHVALAGERVYASVVTEQAGVRDYLLTQEPRLAGGLSAQGLEIGAFQVAVEHQGEGKPDHREAAARVRSVNQDDANEGTDPKPGLPGGASQQGPSSDLLLSLFV